MIWQWPGDVTNKKNLVIQFKRLPTRATHSPLHQNDSTQLWHSQHVQYWAMELQPGGAKHKEPPHFPIDTAFERWIITGQRFTSQAPKAQTFLLQKECSSIACLVKGIDSEMVIPLCQRFQVPLKPSMYHFQNLHNYILPYLPKMTILGTGAIGKARRWYNNPV